MNLYKNRSRPFLDVEDVVSILETYADYKRYNTPRKNGKRNRELVETRALYMYVLHNFTGLSLSKIGELFKDTKGRPKNHATVLHSVKNFLPVYSVYNGGIRQMYENILVQVNKNLEILGYGLMEQDNRMTRLEALHYIQHQRKIIFRLMKTNSE